MKSREFWPSSTNETRIFIGILLGQTAVIGGDGRYDRAACRDITQTGREVARARQGETVVAARTLRQSTS